MGPRFSSLPKPLCRSFMVETPDRLAAPAAWDHDQRYSHLSATTHRHFRFDHGSGLGVTGIGQRFAKDAERLFDLSQAPEEAVVVRSFFTALGDALPARLKPDIAGTDLIKQGPDRATNGGNRA